MSFALDLYNLYSDVTLRKLDVFVRCIVDIHPLKNVECVIDNILMVAKERNPQDPWRI